MATQEIRKDFRSLKDPEKLRFVNAVKEMRNPATTGDPELFTKFARWHGFGEEGSAPSGFLWSDRTGIQAHSNTAFLPWHRVLIRLFELEMQAADLRLNPGASDKIAIPYWNSVEEQDKNGPLWQDDLMGKTDPVTELVISGPFAPNWTNWKGNPLKRRPTGSSSWLPKQSLLDTCINKIKTYDNPPYNNGSTDSAPALAKDWSMRRFLEKRIHDSGHVWVGGLMVNIRWSPSDPVFFMHHCFIDYIWSRWQRKNPEAAKQYPSDTEINNYRDGLLTGVSPNPSLMRRSADAGDPDLDAMRPWKFFPTADPDYMRVYVDDVLNWENMTHSRLKGAANGYRYDVDDAAGAKPFVLT